MKTEMVSVLNSSIIGGNLVQMDNKNRYHVTDKNGSKKVLTQDQFKRNLENNYENIMTGREFKFQKQMSPLKKTILTLLGIGGAAIGIYYRKNIINFFKKPNLKEKLNDIAQSESGQKVKKAVDETVDKVKDALKNPEKTGEKAGEKAKEITEKVTTKTLNLWDKFANFVRGFKKK